MEATSSTSRMPESGATSDHPVAQLLRLPSRSGLAVSPSVSSSAYTREIDSQLLTMYSNQVGGHRVLVKPLDSSIVLKPYDEAEFEFYDRCVPLVCSALMPFTARCYGEVDLRAITPEHGGSSVIPGKSGKFVMLEDLAHGIARPCILDLKMGLKQRSIRNYSEKKLKSKEEKSVSTTSHRLGFRLCGAQLYKDDDANITFYNKYFGRLQDDEGTYSVLKSFFDSLSNPTTRDRIIASFVHKLEELRLVIRSLAGFRFWSGSLLLIVDSATTADAEYDVEGSVILKMIDFANYTQIESSESYDGEYDFGIECLLTFIDGIRKHQDVSTVLGRLRSPPDASIQDRELLMAVERYRMNHT
jgi:hypothetical protein